MTIVFIIISALSLVLSIYSVISMKQVVNDYKSGKFVGEAGPQGLKGDKGDTGARGPQGLKGDKGDPGKDGIMINKETLTADDIISLISTKSDIILSNTKLYAKGFYQK